MKGFSNKNNYFLIVVFITIFCSATFFCLHYSINPQFITMDYIWNYGFSAKIYEGLMPYRDFNLLQTPLSFYVTALLFNLLGNYFISYAIIGGFFIALTFYLFYRAILLITDNQPISINTSLLTLIYAISALALYNYNTLSIIIILSVIMLEYKSRHSTINNIAVGFLLGLLFLTKQNIFVVIVMLSSLNIIIAYGKTSVKLRILFIRGLACLLTISLYIIYLYFNGALYQFIDYAFLGLLDFSDKNKLTGSPLLYLYCLLPAVILIKSIYLIIKQRRYGLDDKLFITIFYAVGGLSMIYPLFDLNHLTMGFILTFLLVPFVFPDSERLRSPLFKTLFIACFGSLFIANSIKVKSDEMSFNSGSNHYQYVITKKDNIDQMNAVIDYIRQEKEKGNTIVMLDTRAMAYFSELSIYNDPFDMLVQGNLGYKGEEKIAEKINQLESKTLFLVGDTNRIQELDSLKAYVMCHYDYVEKVSMFFVYRKPDVVKVNPECDFQAVDIKQS